MPSFEIMIMHAAAIGLRVGGVFTFMPFFGSVAIPAQIKAILVLLCTVALYPLIPLSMAPFSISALAQVALSEAMLGLLMGLCLQFVFEAVQLAGQISGFQLSFSLVNVIDPQTDVDTPVLANLQQLIVLFLFLQLNVHHWILRAIQRSFERVPPGSVAFSLQHVRDLFQAATGMWTAGLQLAAPVLLATVILDVTVGLVSKAAPQIPALFLSIPLKTLAGFIVLALALGLWPVFFERQFSNALAWSWHMMELAH